MVLPLLEKSSAGLMWSFHIRQYTGFSTKRGGSGSRLREVVGIRVVRRGRYAKHPNPDLGVSPASDILNIEIGSFLVKS